MAKTVGVAVALLLASSVGGCRTWGTSERYTWKVKAPAKLEKPIRESTDLVFQVETYLPNGEAAEGISFYWVIQWVGLQGWDHKGTSFSDQSIRAKGGIGTAYIRIYAYDKDSKLVEVAKQPFEVVSP